ncbi:MAG: DUF2130 domain-containing protein [Flavobacteriales bacterium]|nr:DUF2130 domain-containing protein [Flavobacteriales bacterium]
MKTQNLKITCSNCKTQFDLDQAIVSQFQESIRLDLQAELERRETELKNQKKELSQLQQSFEQEKEDLDSIISKRVKTQLQDRETALKESIRDEIQREKEAQLAELEDELRKKSSQLIELNQTKAKLARLSREYEEKEAKIHLKMEQELSERLESMKSSVKEELQMESFLKIKEKENIIDSLKNKLADAQKRIEQGSMQLQGEAQELVLEDMLRETHSVDLIEEIKKGANGADCIQTVITQSGAIAGSILYESKNTKTWSSSFIKKLKQDNLKSKADIMVIVTKTLPKGFEGKYGLIDGVWVTTLQNAKDLPLLLRYGLLKTYSVIISQTGKQDKMSLLYDYLTSEEFKNTFESILEGFKQLQDSHHDEQRKMQLLWKKRAKHLEQVLSSTIDFYGNIKGISGAIQDIPMLELPKAG